MRATLPVTCLFSLSCAREFIIRGLELSLLENARMDVWIRATRGMDAPTLERFEDYVRILDPDARRDLGRLTALRITYAFAKDPGAYPSPSRAR